MKAEGRRRVERVQRIHNFIYHFTACVMASSDEEARKKAETSYSEYKAISVK